MGSVFFRQCFTASVGALDHGVIQNGAQGGAVGLDILLSQDGLLGLFVLGKPLGFRFAGQGIDPVDFALFHDNHHSFRARKLPFWGIGAGFAQQNRRRLGGESHKTRVKFFHAVSLGILCVKGKTLPLYIMPHFFAFVKGRAEKMRIKDACLAEEARQEEKSTFGLGARFRIALIAACVALLSVGVYAATVIAHFYMEQDGSEIHVSAGLDSSIADKVEEPNRAWNAEDGELMVKLDFAYLPDDITPDLTANGKYDGTDNTRAMTFMAHDLRISDLETVRDGYESVEEFMAGENRAYLLTSDSEIALYNKYIFILFEEEHLVIEAYVGCGITEDEIKEIASGLSVVETDDVSEALPIANEVRGGDTSDIPDVFYSPAPEIYREDLLAAGDSAHYEDYFGDHRDMTVLDVTIEDGISFVQGRKRSGYVR